MSSEQKASKTVANLKLSSSVEQQIHFCTTHDGTRIAYATVGEGCADREGGELATHLKDGASAVDRVRSEHSARVTTNRAESSDKG